MYFIYVIRFSEGNWIDSKAGLTKDGKIYDIIVHDWRNVIKKHQERVLGMALCKIHAANPLQLTFCQFWFDNITIFFLSQHIYNHFSPRIVLDEILTMKSVLISPCLNEI